MERITDKYVFFYGGEFSNFYHCYIKYKNYAFTNTEQIFMWEKALYFNDMEIANEILKTTDPSLCKALGRKVRNFDDKKWGDVSYQIMVDANYEKFTQNKDLLNVLLSTNNKTIVEASPYDVIWGIGIHWADDNVLDENKWRGQNLLGKALMEVRDRIFEEMGEYL